MVKLQYNPLIWWVHLKSTHAHWLIWGNNKFLKALTYVQFFIHLDIMKNSSNDMSCHNSMHVKVEGLFFFFFHMGHEGKWNWHIPYLILTCLSMTMDLSISKGYIQNRNNICYTFVNKIFNIKMTYLQHLKCIIIHDHVHYLYYEILLQIEDF